MSVSKPATEPKPATSPEDVNRGGGASDPDRPEIADLRGRASRDRDRSAHRRHHWLYEDLLN